MNAADFFNWGVCPYAVCVRACVCASSVVRHDFAPPPCSESWVFHPEGGVGGGEGEMLVNVGGVQTAGGRLLGSLKLSIGGLGGGWRRDVTVPTNEGGEKAEGGGEPVGYDGVIAERERWR